jgi:hypothetical protein
VNRIVIDLKKADSFLFVGTARPFSLKVFTWKNGFYANQAPGYGIWFHPTLSSFIWSGPALNLAENLPFG